MQTITIFTKVFSDANISDITRISQAGNLAPINLVTPDGVGNYMSSVSCDWNPDSTFIPDESMPVEELIPVMVDAFAQLRAEEIEAIKVSIQGFLILQERPEFGA